MRVAPAVAWEISAPPTTPRGTARSSSLRLTTFMGRRLRRHAGELAAGDVEDLAVDEVRPRRTEEEHAAGRLLGGAGTPQRDQQGGHAAHLVRDAELDLLAADLHLVVVDLGRGQARLDPAEGDRVDVDLELAPLVGQRLGEADDAALAGRVVGLTGIAHRPGDRGDVDDLAEDLLAALALLLGGLAQVRRGRTDDAEGDDRVD